MRTGTVLSLGLLMVAGVMPGCVLPRNQGPVSQSVLSSRHYSQQGQSAMERGQWSQAETVLAQAVKTCPVNAEARRHYAEVLWRRGASWEAIAQLEESSRLAPEDAALHARVAEMRLAVGQVEVAQRRADQAVDLDPRLPQAWAARARVARAAGQRRQALADYQRASGFAPGDRQILLETADLYREMDQPHRALATLQNLCDTFSPGEEPQESLQLLGQAYQAVGRDDVAIGVYTRALARGPHTSDLLCRLGEALWLQGRTTEAETALQEAIAIDPKHQPSQELLGRVQLARESGTSVRR